MKSVVALLLCITLLLGCAGCTLPPELEITCQDVIRVYQQAGYGVWHIETPESEDGEVCYVKILDNDSDEYIYFEFYDSPETAQAYAEQRQWNVLLWLFSVIYGDPQWVITKTYGKIEYEYKLGTELIEPFFDLIGHPTLWYF